MLNFTQNFKNFIIHGILLFILLFLPTINLQANEIAELKTYHVSMKIPNNFHKTKQSLKRLTFEHEDFIATINVRLYNFTEAVTANGFQTRRRIGHYDGWENLLERNGSEEEAKRSNTEESYLAVYSKNELDENLMIQKVVVAEYYYIKTQQRGVVISVIAKHQDWPSIKASVRQLIDSFWIGPEERWEETEFKKKNALLGKPR